MVPFLAMAPPEKPDRPRMVQVTLKVPEDVLEAYDAAATAAGLSRHRWMRLFLDSASGATELQEQFRRIIEYVPTRVRDGKW